MGLVGEEKNLTENSRIDMGWKPGVNINPDQRVNWGLKSIV